MHIPIRSLFVQTPIFRFQIVDSPKILSLIALLIVLHTPEAAVPFKGSLLAQEADEPMTWRLNEGDQFVLQLEQKSVTATTVDRRTVRLFSTTLIEFDWEVTAVDDSSNATIEQSIRSIRLQVENPEFPSQAVSLDTRSDQRPRRESLNLLRQVEPLIGLKFIVQMSAQGELITVDVPDETLAVLRELPGSLKLQDLFSQEGIKDLMGSSIVTLPENPVALGDQWEANSLVDNHFGRFSRLRKYTYSDKEVRNNKQFAMITMETTQKLQQPNSQPTGTLLSYSETGKLIFNLSDGHFSSSEIAGRIETQLRYSDEIIKTEIENTYLMSLEKR